MYSYDCGAAWLICFSSPCPWSLPVHSAIDLLLHIPLILLYSEHSMSPTFCISRSPRPSGRSPTTHEIFPHHAQIHEPFLRWTKLPQFHACFQEDLRSFGVHVVTLTIYHLRNSHLHNLDGTCQAGARIAVEYTPVTHSLPSCFQQSILLGMNAQTRAQICSTRSPL